ncbi:MAG TPA: hypothetical protein VH851_13955 [Candidatus Binatia bacterium]|jgi:hypothetical protein
MSIPFLLSEKLVAVARGSGREQSGGSRKVRYIGSEYLVRYVLSPCDELIEKVIGWHTSVGNVLLFGGVTTDYW